MLIINEVKMLIRWKREKRDFLNYDVEFWHVTILLDWYHDEELKDDKSLRNKHLFLLRDKGFSKNRVKRMTLTTIILSRSNYIKTYDELYKNSSSSHTFNTLLLICYNNIKTKQNIIIKNHFRFFLSWNIYVYV